MKLTPESFKASFFSDWENFKPSSDTIPPLLDVFREPQFLPNIMHEVDLSTGKQHPRLRLSTSDNEWLIEWEKNRINIEKKPLAASCENMGLIEDFTRNITDFLGRILSKFPKKGNRLALISHERVDEIDSSQLQEIYFRFNNPIDFYQDHPPENWVNRAVARIDDTIGERTEKFNVITTVSRAQGEYIGVEGNPFDRIDLKFDINTFQGNQDNRFEITDMNLFFQKVLEIRKNLIEKLEQKIHG
jgi:hypothetical protein